MSPFVPDVAGGLLIGPQVSFDFRRDKPDWIGKLIKQNDINLKNSLERYVEDSSSSLYGGILDSVGMATAHSVTGFVRNGMNALISPESSFYQDLELLEKLVASANFLLSVQHDDGTIDLVTTNFHSTPDTAFIVKWLAPGYRMLLESTVPGKERLEDPLLDFLLRAGEALKIGGIHTPNHRWVVCSALAELYRIKPDPGYLKRAEVWLAEKIDMDPDGQYNEKSSYIYSSLSNRVLISTARGFDKPELLDYVRKNLEMTYYYIHPNGEIVTEASGRQDNSIIGTLENYYYAYRYFAIKDQNPMFAAACELIERTAFLKLAGFLYYLLDDRSLWQQLPQPEPLPTHYAKHFSHSGLVRIRRGDYDGSILAKSAVFFTFHKLKNVLQGVRFASAFFGKGQFVAEEIKEEGGKYILTSYLEGPYYQPLPVDKLPDDGDWEKMPRSLRPQSEVQKYKASVSIAEIDGGFGLDVEIGGTDHVPFALEFIFRQGGKFSNVVAHESMEDAYFLKEGEGIYTVDEEDIRFGPGVHHHQWVEIRGGLPRMNAPTVFVTGFTPFRERFYVR